MKRSSLLSPLLCLIATFVLSACEQTEVASREPVTLSAVGATAMQPVLAELTSAFQQQHPHVVFDLRGGGSELGETQIRSGQVDLAASTLLPRDDEQEQIQRIPIGLDGLVVIVNEQQSLESLTSEQLQAIFAGDVLNWSSIEQGRVDPSVPTAAEETSQAEEDSTDGEAVAVALEDEILLVSREGGSGSRIVFEERIMQDAPVSLTAVVMPTSADVVDYVASRPSAIGYVSAAYLTESGVNSERVQSIAVDGLLPSDRTLRDQSYLLVQPLYLLMQTEPDEWVRQFVDFALSPAGQSIVSRYHTRLR